jgi:hypothetical protein
MAKRKPRWETLWEEIQKAAARSEWLEQLETDPSAAWQKIAQNCAEDSYKNNFPSRRGTYVINDMPTKGGQVMCLYNNNPYKKPFPCRHREKETEFFREQMKEAKIGELGYATYPLEGDSAGYSYAMILNARDNQIGIVHDAMKAAMKEAYEWVEGLGAEEENEVEEEAEQGESGIEVEIVVPETIRVDESFQIRHARVGQDIFSRAVRNNYGHRCCFPGCEVDHDALLVGAHIARWSDNPESRGDVSNGLCLCVLHDKAFECGFFTLTDELCVEINSKKSASSAWAKSELNRAAGEKIKLGRIMPSLDAIRQHRARHM